MASSKYEYYRHRPVRSTSWLWWIAAASLFIGLLIFFTLRSGEMRLETESLRRLVLTISISISAICAVLATSYRWFYR